MADFLDRARRFSSATPILQGDGVRKMVKVIQFVAGGDFSRALTQRAVRKAHAPFDFKWPAIESLNGPKVVP